MLATSFIAREDYLERIRSTLLDQDQVRILGLWGAGGFGKTTLADAVSRDVAIREAFNDGIFWVVLGQNVSEGDLVTKMNDLVYLVSGRRPELQDLHMIARQFAVELGEKSILLVADDVWRLSDLEPFLQGRNSRFLLTSRDRSCLPGEAIVIPVREMTDKQSKQLLLSGLDGDVDRLDELLPICAGWPVLLNIINARLRQDCSDGISLGRSIDLIVKAHQESGLSAFDQDSGKYREVALSSLLIDSVERRGAKIKESCLDLGIFPEDAEIPTSVLAKYWGMQETRVLDLCRGLYDASVVERYSIGQERPTIQLHDAIREALRVQAGPSLEERSARFIEATRPQGPSGAKESWLELPPSELYLWRHLGWHLRSAGYWPEFVETFGDLAFLAAHSGICGRAVTLREVTLAAAFSPDLGKIRDFLHRKGHLLDPLSAAPDRQTTLAIHLGGAFPQGPHFEVVWSRRSVAEDGPVAGHKGSATSCDADQESGLIATTGSDGEVHIHRWPMLGERVTCRGHSGWVRCAAVLPGRSQVVSGGDDNSLRLWEVESGQCRTVLLGHAGSVRACAVLPGRGWIVSVSDDTTVRLWEASTGKSVGILEGHRAAVLCCAADPAERWIISGSEDGTLRLWALDGGEAPRVLNAGKGAVRCCAVEPEGRWFVSGGNDSILRIWSVKDGEIVREIPGHRRTIRACALSSDGSRVVSAGGDDRTLRVSDIKTGEVLAVLETDGSWVMGCRFLSDDTIVATSVDGSTRFWSSHTWERLAIVEGQSTFLWACAAGKGWAVAGGVDGTVTELNLADGKILAKIRDHRACIRRLRIARGKRLVFSASDDGEIRRWEPGADQTAIVCRHVGGARSLAIGETHEFLLTCGHDGLVKVWDVRDEHGARCVSEFKEHTAEVLDCDFLPSDGELQAVSVSSDTTARIWRVGSGEEIRRLTGHRRAAVSCSVSPPERTLATVSDDLVVRIWDLATFEHIALEGHRDWISQAVFSPDGRILATTSDDRTVRLWDCESGAPLAALALDEPIYACDWCDGCHLLVAGAGGVVFLDYKGDRMEANGGGRQER